jgi:hypothetical protein
MSTSWALAVTERPCDAEYVEPSETSRASLDAPDVRPEHLGAVREVL